MNKTTTRFLFLSIFVLTFFSLGAQNINTIGTEAPGLVCPGGTGKIDKDTTESYPYTYQYWDGESWACCFGGNQTPYHISIPATGQWVEVQRKYTNGVAEFKRESVGFFYTPVTPQIEAVPYPGTCNTSTGRIVVTDRSTNFSTMPRRFKLYDQNNVLRGNIVVDTSIYSFVNLPAGTYSVIVETPCNSVYSEKTDIIVTTNSQNPVLDIALSGNDDCLENNINASIILPESIPTAGVQYQMDGGTWQSSTTFSNVTPWLTHQFAARLSGCFESNTTQFVSELSIPRIQGLERAKDTDCTPANNEIRVFVPEGSDAQIQFNHSGGWYNPGQWIGPLPDGTLHIRARSAYLPSCYRDTLISLSEHGSVSLLGADASNLTDCTLGNISLQLRTEPSVSSGLEYFVEGKGWQNSAGFSALNNGNKHIAIRSTGLCQVGIAADTIALNEIIPPQIESIAPYGHDDCVIGNAGFTVYLVQSVAGVKYRINGGAWQEGNLFQNRPAGNYLVEVARADGSCLSSQNFALVETGSVNITGLSKANENDCVVGNAQFQVLHTGGSQEGLKFRLNGGAWQDSAIFRNLTRMAVNVEAQIQKPTCTSSIVAWPDSIREQSNFPRIDATVISNDKDCTAGNARVTISLKSPMAATYWLSASKNNSTGIFTNLSSGTYTFEVYQSRSGCIDRRTVVIDEKLGFTLDSLRVQGGEDCLNNNAQVTVFHPYGNNYGLQFREVNRNTTWQNSNAFPLSTHGVGQYDLQARNANGCTIWSGSINGQERQNPEISGVLGIDGLSDCALGNVTAQVQLLNSIWGSTKQYRVNGGAWNLSNTLPGFRHGSNLVELTYNFGGLGTQQCTINKTIVIDEKAKEITGVLLDAATLNDCSLNNVKATIQVDGPTSNLRYVVTGKTEGTSNMFTNLNNGQYKAIIRDVVSTCRDTMVFTIAETPALAVPSPTVQNVICYGAATGSISTSPTGGMAPYTYLWSTGATSASVTGLVAGTYNVTVNDSRGCSLSQTVPVTGPAQSNLPQISFTGDTSICRGASFSVSASGGGSYAWNSGATSSTISGSPENTTTYTVTVTNGTGCSASASHTITVNPLPVPNIEGINTICAGQSTTLTATGGSSYAWQHGATGANITVNPTSTTTYKVTVTNAAGCSAIYNRTVRVNALPVVQIAGAPTGPLCGTGSVLLTAISTTATSYRWSTNETSATITQVLNASAGFGVTVKDINGCEASTGASVSVIPRPQAQILGGDIPCRRNSTVLTAIGGSSYLWSNNATTSSIAISQPTQNQTYSVTVSNGLGCSSVVYKTVVVPDSFNLSHDLNGIDDCIANNVEVIPTVTGGQGNVNLSLIRSGELYPDPVLNGLRSGTYVLRAEDSKGCLALDEVMIAETLPMITRIDLSGLNDCTRHNVTLNVVASGSKLPLIYRLNGNTMSGTTASVPSGTHFIEVQDAIGCIARDTITVNETPYLNFQANLYNVSCFGKTDGKLTTQPTVNNIGTPPYTYAWSTGATTSEISQLGAGLYSLTVTDTRGCTSILPVIPITQPSQLEVEVEITDTLSCFGSADAAVAVTVSGGTAPYIYVWSTGASSTSIEGLPSGTYSVTVIDNKGCEAIAQVTVLDPPKLMLTYTLLGDTLDCVRGNVQVTLSTTAAQGTVSYHFDSPQSAILAPSSFNSSSLQRWVYAVDTLGCRDSVEVVVQDSIITDLINDFTLAFDRDCIDGNAAITLQLSSAGATLPLSFQLNRETPTAQFHFDSLRAGYYLVRARYQDCRDSVAVLVDERIPRITGFQYLNQDDCKPNNTGVKLQAVSGWGTLRYQVDTLAPQDSTRFDSLTAGSHRFLVIDSLQCRDSLLIPISSEQPAYISVEDLVKCDSASGRISFRPNTQGVAAEYSIDGGKHWQTEVVFDSLPPGIYQPLRRKPSTGCIDSLNTVVLGRHCDTIPEAYFLQDTIRITEPNTSVLIRWEATAPKWYRDTFYVKMKLEGDGFPHFNDGSRTTARTPELRGGDPLAGPNVYRYIGGGTHRDSLYLPMQDSAHLYTYPADYYFTLSTPLGGKTLVDPDRDITRVTVSLLGPEVPEEDVKVTLCKNCTTIGNDDVTGVNCYYWPDFPNPGQKTQEVCTSGQFTRMALDENLVVIKKTVYTVKLSDLKVTIKEDFAVPRSCSPDDNFLEAVATSTAEGAITFKWSTGATTQRIKLRSDVSTYTVTVTQGDCTAEASYTQEVENDACELKKYFEDNGFFAIPISNLQKPPALRSPELRDDCPQPRGDANGKVKDFAGYTFEVNGGQVDPKSQLTQALNRFESVFGYSNGSGIITSNDEVCACPNYLSDKQAGFAAQAGLQFWYHIFKNDDSCPELACDLLFIKAKMPNGKTYPAGAQDVAFLGAGYGVATQDIGLQGSTLLTALDDLCLDNFAAAKDPDMFELEPEEEEPEKVEELQVPCNQLGFHLEPVAVVAPTGQVMLAPKNSVWRFRRPGTEQFVDGALTGFTQVTITEGEESIAIRYEPGGIPLNPCTPWIGIKLYRVKVGRKWIWGDRYEARTDPNQPNHLKGYFQVLGIKDKAFTFEVPPYPTVLQPLKIYTGKLDRAASTSQCGLKYTIYSNHLIYDPPKGFSTEPKGILIKTLVEAGLGIPKAEYTYRICREDLVKLASSVNFYSKLGTLEVYMWKPSNSLNPGLYYKIEVNGKKAYVFVADDPGVGRRYYQFNCALGIWEEIVDPELSAVLPKLKHLDALWEVFLKRTEIHTKLGLVSVVPFVGNLAAIANGVLYVNEGQAGQGTFEIVVGVLGLGLDIVEAGSLIRAGAAGGRGALVQSIWSVNCPSAPPFRSEVELRSVLSCNVTPVLGQAGAKIFNESIGTAATTIGGDVLPKVEGLFNEFLKSSKGTAFLKWLHANQGLIPDVTKIITNAFGKLDFTVADFIKLSDDLIANSSLISKLASSSRNLEWWLKLLRAGKNASRLSAKVYEQIAKFPDGILDDLLFYSDNSFKEFMDIADDALIAELVANPDLVKGLVSHKNAAYLTYFDDAVDYATEILETPAGAKLLEWLNYSRETGSFLSRMAEANTFARNILERFRSLFGYTVQSEVSFIVKYGGKEFRTRIDGITIIDDEFVAIECKMGGAVLSDNQEAFFNALKNGGEVIPVGRNAEEIFGLANINKNVRDKFASYWFKNETRTGL
ncbi:hypothetical protein [Haliscomenobacter sp.]|uniref:SprB repeat-containing protein n=1 Tax=Haliscomenobacter sp. TaxID=2717303 RepID=UPI003594261D